eukprot:6275215-Amphidinium_carterae.2
MTLGWKLNEDFVLGVGWLIKAGQMAKQRNAKDEAPTLCTSRHCAEPWNTACSRTPCSVATVTSSVCLVHIQTKI